MSGCRGLTFIELMAVLIVLLLIAGAVSRLLTSSWASERTIVSQNDLQREAARAVDTIVDALRAGSAIQGGSSVEVTAGFPGGSTARYYLEGGELRRDRYSHATGATTTGEVICSRCQSLGFAYLRRSGGVLQAAAPETAESVQVTVTAAQEGFQATEKSVVKLRNKI